MSLRTALRTAMPAMLHHEGVWEGVYRHLDPEGREIDHHSARVTCIFPEEGPFAYIQHNVFTWDDGRTQEVHLPGVLRDGRLWWDVPTFHGSAWESHDGMILLHLLHKDMPDAEFYEMIVRPESSEHRARTWQWFQHGRLIRRTLCDERRVAG